MKIPTKRYLERLPSFHDLDLFDLNSSNGIDPDLNDICKPIRCRYFSPASFASARPKNNQSHFSLLHSNIRSLKHNFENLQTHLLCELKFNFSVIGLSETRIYNSTASDSIPMLPNYKFESVPTPLSAGGVGMYIDENLNYTVVERITNEAFQALWVQIEVSPKRNVLCCVTYRQHNSPESFLDYFEDALVRFSATGKPIYVLGDININILRAKTCKYSQKFLSCLQSFALMPTIDKPTRVYSNSATLIDNIFTNKLDDYFASGNIVSDITDHFSQFLILQSLVLPVQPKKIILRDFSRFSEKTFLQEMSQIDWAMLLVGDINKIFSTFYNKLNKITNKHAPFRTLSKRKAKQMSKPWMTRGLKKSIKVKNELFFTGDKDKYKYYRNKITVLTRISKKNYFYNFFESNINNMKKTWDGINNLINKKMKCKTAINKMKRIEDNSVSSNQSEISNILNKHFATIGHNLASKIPPSSSSFLSFMPPRLSSVGSFVFKPVIQGEIEDEIRLLPLNKAAGLYSTPVRILKTASHLLSYPLATMINKSVQMGVYPNKLKHAKIIPVYKSDDIIDPNNYRPISLLSIFNRIFEKVMCNRLQIFLDKHEVLYYSQYGFRKNCSTEHALIDIVSKIQSNIDKKLYSCGVFIDLKKAFDTVDYSILLSKLDYYGIRGIINNWFSSYLTNRYQTTQIGCHISQKELCRCGVPQGSVLGPILFLIYINDIYMSSDKFYFYLFADDTNLLYANSNLKVLEATVNYELSKVSSWLMVNKLTLNVQKSNFVIFHPRQRRVDYNVKISVFDNNKNKYVPLERKNYVKYLGVLIDSKLTWQDHISYISSKISKTVGIISRLRHFVPIDILANIYRSLIQPYLLYGLTVWGQAAQTYLEKLLILQKRAMRFIFFAPYRTHAISFFHSLNLLPLSFLYFKSVSSIMYDVSKDAAPESISRLFATSSETHNYNTRFASSGNFQIKHARTNYILKSFSSIGARMWNSIPLNIRALPKQKFKATLHSQLLSILVEEDSYIDTHTLISAMSKL